ncbi:hypothetical protein NEOLEDRAFT_1133037 [Neolentinus lepideus HHB14362 ss-1]|uniref:Uncharacterized protein n=1 Tax=Neolentinus lepideus HHB14362 ss-1 TaxID=1314782 RepID=A0A165T0S8_9AGAM|nr:hypothetical protein NEOLEDRAFT_1133037 [Neolentinus lepideus HHB14362 ss-1]
MTIPIPQARASLSSLFPQHPSPQDHHSSRIRPYLTLASAHGTLESSGHRRIPRCSVYTRPARIRAGRICVLFGMRRKRGSVRILAGTGGMCYGIHLRHDIQQPSIVIINTSQPVHFSIDKGTSQWTD